MVFFPARRIGVVIGAAMACLALVCAVLLAWRITAQPLSFASFTAALVALGMLLLALLFGYWTWGCFSLAYRLSRNALVVEWAGNQQRIPLAEVTALAPGRSLPLPVGLTGLGWPGYRIGRGMVQGVPVLIMASYERAADLLYVHTARMVYAVSPGDAEHLAMEIKRRQEMGPSTAEVQRVRRWLLWDISAWHDKVAVGLLLAALVLNLAVFAYETFLMPAVPDETILHLTPLGLVDRSGPKAELLLLPLAGLAMLLVNATIGMLLHLWERFAAYLALSAGVVMQGLVFAAAFRLLNP